jgi:hypothetical protein
VKFFRDEEEYEQLPADIRGCAKCIPKGRKRIVFNRALSDPDNDRTVTVNPTEKSRHHHEVITNAHP